MVYVTQQCEKFDALERFFYVLENRILELLENMKMYLQHLQVNSCTHFVLSVHCKALLDFSD